jgi:hypothetical protein
MSGMTLPVQRPTGQALLVAGTGNRAKPLEILRDLGFDSAEFDDPYSAMTELCRRPLVYRAVILSLAGLYREELSIIPAVKSRFPHVELWLAHTDGRQAALAEAMRLGADGLLADDGLHRVAGAGSPSAAEATATAAASGSVSPTVTAPVFAPSEPSADVSSHVGSQDDLHDESGQPGPILTPDELRALLHEQSSVPRDED